MAEVYRAKATGAERFQRLFAIKCMLSQLNEDEQFTTMFVDEAKLAAHLNHANIVQIYELGRINQQLYIAMELVNGRDLRHIIRRATAAQMAIPVGFAAYVISKAAEGLDFAHRQLGIDGSPLNLVHRDVSPQNILVSYDGEVKVADFGIAKAEVRDTETRAGVLKGKSAYMAPEQVMGSEIDRRADIFALGAVLYEILTGQKLFRGESDFSILEKVRAAQVPRISTKLADVPEEVDAILARALCRDRNSRYAWASDLSEGLSPMLIDHRSIFGAKQAKEFMQTLYASDIDLLTQQLREYAKTGEDDCVEVSGQKRDPRNCEVFESDFSTFDEPLDAPRDGDHARKHPPTCHSDRNAGEMEPQSTGWTGIEFAPAFGREGSDDATRLFKEASSSACGPPDRPLVEPLGETAGQAASAKPIRPVSVPGADSSASGLPAQPHGGMGKPILIGLIVATTIVLVAVVVVFVMTRSSGHTSTVVMPVTVPDHAPVATAPPQPTTVVAGTSTIEPPPSPPTSPAAVPAPIELDSPPAVETERKGKKPKKGRPKFGFISVSAMDVKAARVFVDGKDLGYAPLVYQRVRTGKHRIKVVEVGGAERSKVLDVIVAGNNTRKDPLRLFVTL
jgi:serine/threonine protein kinase